MTSQQIKNVVQLLQGNPMSKINQFLSMYNPSQKKEIADYMKCPTEELAIRLSIK